MLAQSLKRENPVGNFGAWRAVGAEMSRAHTEWSARRRAFLRRVRIWTRVLALPLALYTLVWGGDHGVAQTPMCPPPTSSQRIECTKDATTNNIDIDIDAEGVDIDTTAADKPGIKATHGGTGNIFIDVLAGVSDGEIVRNTIDTTGSYSHGVYGQHQGTGNIDILASHTDLTMTNPGAHGVYGQHQGTGNIDVNVNNARITNMWETASDTVYTTTPTEFSPIIPIGVYARHQGFGKIKIDVSEVDITTAADHANAIFGVVQNTEADIPENVVSDLTIKARNVNLTTSGRYSAHGISAWHQRTSGSRGDITIDARFGTINTRGRGIGASHQSIGDLFVDARDLTISASGESGAGIWVKQEAVTTGSESGKVDIYAENLTIKTLSTSTYGILGWVNKGAANVDIDVRNTTIKSLSTGFPETNTLSHGLLGIHEGEGAIDIDLRGGSIETRGTFSYGIYGLHRGDGTVMIDTHPGHSVTTTGPSGHGIVAYHYGTAQSTSLISIDAEGNIDVSGAGAQGVRVGALTSGVLERVAAIGADGYRQQTVTVNGAVTSAAEGVYLAGGGRVVIGPQGSIASDSGIAILATGTVAEVPAVPDDLTTTNVDESMPAMSAITPKLRVDMNLGGRRVEQAIGDDWIINDGGETTIAVNNTVLHEGEMGVVEGAVARNGAWNVRMREEGVTVTDRTTDPWMISTPAAGVITDRDFSTEDFNETRRPTPPPPPSCPAGQVGSPPNCMPPPSPSCPAGQVGSPPNCMPPPSPSCPDGQVGTPPNCAEPMEPERPMFMEEYAPRAAVYEALPDFLLRLTGPGPNRKCRTAPEERVWVRFAGGQGSYEADRTTTGASYDLERFETEGGFSANFNERVKGWASVRHVWGSADAMSPTGGGAIDVRGLGSSVGGAWRSETGAYAMGCFSYMTYNVDMASRQAGLLRAGVDSRAYTLDFEAGLPFALTEQVQMTPRVWVVSSQVSVDSFTDTVEARVSFGDADRITGGLGFLADTTRPWGEGEFILRGSVDLERLLSGTETRVQVSGERLSAVATDSSLLVGLNGIYRQGRFSIGAEVAARQELGSNDSEYASFLNLGISF